jgi:hypothetical protein
MSRAPASFDLGLAPTLLRSDEGTPSRHWYAFPLWLFVVTRICYLAFGYLALRLVPAMRVQGGLAGLRQYPALDALCRWDCGWFGHLARNGYEAATGAAPGVSTNFWPGLPMAARVLAWVSPIPIDYAILLIPNVFCLAAYLVLYRVFARLEGESTARWSLLVLAAFPLSFFHSSGYPETIMIFFSAAAVLLGSTRRHISAGVCLGLGVLARHLTILMGCTLLAAQVRERGFSGLFKKPLPLLGLLAPFLLAGLYLLYCWRVFHDPLMFWKARSDWGATAWWGAREALENFQRRPQVAVYIPLALLPTIGAIALLFRRSHLELAAAVIPLLIVLWAIGGFGLGRYAASCWPAFLPWGRWLDRHPMLRFPLLTVLVLLQGWYFFLHIHHFEVQ